MERAKKKTIRMNGLEPGEKGKIGGIFLKEGIKQKLQDMGFELGSLVECAYKSPFGDPAAYFVKGVLIAVRSEDAQNVIIEIGDEMRK